MNRFPTVAILITATFWIGFAVWLGFKPGALLPAFGIDRSTPQMLTEVRAFYGGVQMAIAVAMLILWWRDEPFASLLIGGLPLVGSAIGRFVGLVVDGYYQMHAGFAALECVGAAFCLVGCLVVSSAEQSYEEV